jgi:MscS family membrane protein
MLLALWCPVDGVTDDGNPLEPLDLSSPRATLNNFLTTSDAFFSLLRDDYWQAPSRAAAFHLSDSIAPLERTLDLSEIPPASRRELGRDGVIYLYEVLSRIELPHGVDIPDAAAIADDKSASWTIPRTEIT